MEQSLVPRAKALKITALIFAFLFSPGYAYANAGTPLMWFTMLHLLIGNCLIGLGEGALIVILFKTKRVPTLLIMILANYVSMIAGGIVIHFFGDAVTWPIMQKAPLYLAPKAMFLLLILLYLLTIILEWSFCRWILKDRTHRNKMAWTASAVVQTASYAVIVPVYFFISPTSLYTDIRFDPTLSFAKNNASVYFISDKDGSVDSIRTNGSNRNKVLKTIITGQDARLFVRKAKDSVYNNLWAIGYPAEKSETLLIKNFTTGTASVENEKDRQGVHGTWFNLYSPYDLRNGDQRKWEVDTGFWAAEGLRATNSDTGEVIRVAFETPFMSWYARNAIVLPGDQVIYQLGNHQIVLIDLNERKMGIVAMGRGPVVVLDNEQ